MLLVYIYFVLNDNQFFFTLHLPISLYINITLNIISVYLYYIKDYHIKNSICKFTSKRKKYRK